MKPMRLIGPAFRAMGRNRLRTAFMMLGVTVGIGTLTALASVGEATRRETLEQFKRMIGTVDTLSVRPGSAATRGMPSLSSVEPTVRFEDAAIVAAVPGVTRVAQVQQAFDLEVVYRDEALVPAVFGVSTEWAGIRGEVVESGENITADDVAGLARVVVIGADVRTALFPDEDPLGKQIRIADVPFQVKGTYATRGAGPGGSSLDNMVVIPVSTASKRLFKRDYLTSLLVQIADPQQSDAMGARIREALREQHRLAPNAPDDFNVTSPRATIDRITRVGTTLGTVMNGVALIATLIGGVVIMGLMLVSVSERRREIGVRRAVGATRGDILGQFLLEAASISLAGGLLGIVLGAAGAAGAAAILQRQAPALLWSVIGLALAASIAVGLLAGLQPAWRAARLDPVGVAQLMRALRVSVRTQQILTAALRQLWRRRLRSLLIVACAAFGVAGAVAAVNYVSGGREQVLDQIRSLGTNLIVVTAQPSRAEGGRGRTGEIVTTLRRGDLDALRREIPEIRRASPTLTAPLRLKAMGHSKLSTVVGVEPAFFDIRRWDPRLGDTFGSDEERRAARVAVLGATLAQDLFEGESPIGERLSINRVPFEVVGVLAERGPGLDAANEDQQVYVPLQTAMRRLLSVDHYSALVLELDRFEQIDAASSAIADLLRERHRVRSSRDEDFRVQSQKALIDTQVASARELGFFVRSIGFGTLLVAGLGVLAMAWIAVRDRTREIGTRRALGATRRDVFVQFAFEATILAAAGAVLGIGLGAAASLAISRLSMLPFVFDTTNAAVALVVALGVNVAFACWPAMRAARLDPIEALRHE